MGFRSLDAGRADALAAAWFATGAARIAWLSSEFPDIALGYTDPSLRLLLREASPRLTFAPREPSAEEPIWLPQVPTSESQGLSTQSLWLVDALALYQGEVIIGHDPLNLRWGVHRDDDSPGPWHQQPAVVGYRWPYPTIEDMLLFAVRAASGHPEDPHHVVSAIGVFTSAFRPRAGTVEVQRMSTGEASA